MATVRSAIDPLKLTDVVCWNDKTISAEIDGDVVTLDVVNGACYSLDAIGARIWAIVQSPIAIDPICSILTSEFNVDLVTCRKDVLDLLADLLAEGLIVVTRPLE